MSEYGKVIESKENTLTISMKKKEACAKCRACSAGLSEKEMIIEADNLCNAKIGDYVSVELNPDGFISALFIIYGLPLIGFMAGVLLGYFLILPNFNLGKLGELICFLLGLLFVGIAFLWIRANEDKWKGKKYKPKAVSKSDRPIED